MVAITVDELNAVESKLLKDMECLIPVRPVQYSGIYCGENPNRKSVSAIVDATLTEDATFSYSKASYCAVIIIQLQMLLGL